MQPVNENLSQDHFDYWSENDLVQVHHYGAGPGSPPGTKTIVTLVTRNDGEPPVVRVPWQPSEEDIVAIAAGGTVWLSQWGGLSAHQLEVQCPRSAGN